MNTLDYIIKKYNINLNEKLPILLDISRDEGLPILFKELGFKVGAEIGVYRGWYSKKLLEGIPDLKLYCIDTWSIYRGYKDYEKGDDLIDAYEEAKENVKGHNGVLIKGKSNEIVKEFEDESLDFVYIDANHSYEYVVEDIALWSKKVRKGGIVSGHDYDQPSIKKKSLDHPNVIEAVNGWVKSYEINPWFVITKDRSRSWMYIKGEF